MKISCHELYWLQLERQAITEQAGREHLTTPAGSPCNQ